MRAETIELSMRQCRISSLSIEAGRFLQTEAPLRIAPGGVREAIFSFLHRSGRARAALTESDALGSSCTTIQLACG